MEGHSGKNKQIGMSYVGYVVYLSKFAEINLFLKNLCSVFPFAIVIDLEK